MSSLDSIQDAEDRAVICTISGDAGVGKTRLAASFPKPVVIRAEDGLQSIPKSQRPKAFPVLLHADDLWMQIADLLHGDHDFETLIVDSITAMDRIFVAEVMRSDPKAKSINQALGGYGAGPAAVSAMHNRLRKGAGLLNARRGMHIVFVAHADVETLRLPDQDDYMRHSLRLPEKSQAPYIDDVDLVGFVRLETYTKGEDGERKKAFSGGDREVICSASPSNVAKNRFGITEVLPFPIGTNPLAAVIPSLGGRDLLEEALNSPDDGHDGGSDETQDQQ